MKTKEEIGDALRTVKIEDGFWGQRVERNRLITMPHVIGKCEDEGHVRNIQIAAGKSDAEYSGGSDRDSDLFKVMEGAAYCLAMTPDKKLESYLDDLIASLAAAQETDGYLQSYFSSQKPGVRYEDLHRSHELYCAGHLIEAAVAHFEATGIRTFLDVAVKLIDHLDRTFGTGKLETVPGHQELELALFRMYRATGDVRCLYLGCYFVDMRGNEKRVTKEYSGKPIIEGDRRPGRNRPPEYRQDHLPAVEQREPIGHAVRAGYLYAAMADIALECDSEKYATAANAIWNNIVAKHLFITGGVGTHQHRDEGFGDDYLLPNDTGYCETCGGIAMMLFTHRMSMLKGEARYADVIETILYNHMLSSTDLPGVNFHYRNPLVSDGTRKRHPWPSPACCPSNIVRMIPQIGRFIYAVNGDSLYVDQFINSSADLSLDAGRVQLTQKTEYPWNGSITITVQPETAFDFALHIRIPGWVDGKPVPSDLYTTRNGGTQATITVNSETIDTAARTNGYCVIKRTWQAGDQIVINFPMTVQRVYAHEKVAANRGRAALMRGPVLYCLEETDLGRDPEEVPLSPETELSAKHIPDLLSGVTIISDTAETIKAVPFCVWNNREPGRMLVWIREAE